MNSELNRHSEKLCAGLNRGGLNYTVSLKLFGCPGLAGSDAQCIVSAGLGADAVIRNAASTSAGELLAEVKRCLEYDGDEGSHPANSYLQSDRFRQDLQGVLASLQALLDQAGNILEFSLKSGHPFYPVFWDFAYIVESGSDAHMLIGSSSD